ncbi:MAG: hypothetical protein IPL53_08425 [Ignavibacteria bacterium]|nr:hypothetical protein [Ignavibacteria bacterium]
MKIQDQLWKKGIAITNITFFFNEYNIQIIVFKIQLPPSLNIKGIGSILILSNGEFPIHLSIDDNILIKYEPRNIPKFRYSGNKGNEKAEKEYYQNTIKSISNLEYYQLEKGSIYEFEGQIDYCKHYLWSKPERFEFLIRVKIQLNVLLQQLLLVIKII